MLMWATGGVDLGRTERAQPGGRFEPRQEPSSCEVTVLTTAQRNVLMKSAGPFSQAALSVYCCYKFCKPACRRHRFRYSEASVHFSGQSGQSGNLSRGSIHPSLTCFIPYNTEPRLAGGKNDLSSKTKRPMKEWGTDLDVKSGLRSEAGIGAAR